MLSDQLQSVVAGPSLAQLGVNISLGKLFHHTAHTLPFTYNLVYYFKPSVDIRSINQCLYWQKYKTNIKLKCTFCQFAGIDFNFTKFDPSSALPPLSVSEWPPGLINTNKDTKKLADNCYVGTICHHFNIFHKLRTESGRCEGISSLSLRKV